MISVWWSPPLGGTVLHHIESSALLKNLVMENPAAAGPLCVTFHHGGLLSGNWKGLCCQRCFFFLIRDCWCCSFFSPLPIPYDICCTPKCSKHQSSVRPTGFSQSLAPPCFSDNDSIIYIIDYNIIYAKWCCMKSPCINCCWIFPYSVHHSIGPQENLSTCKLVCHVWIFGPFKCEK